MNYKIQTAISEISFVLHRDGLKSGIIQTFPHAKWSELF